MKKPIKVSVDCADGSKRFIMFEPIPSDLPETAIICKESCHYGHDLCKCLRDPRNPEDPDSTFTDFCNTLALREDLDSEVISKYQPMEGSIENCFSDYPGIYDRIAEENPLVRLSDVIDAQCKNLCPSYNPDHSNCGGKNSICVLKNLFPKNSTKKLEAE